MNRPPSARSGRPFHVKRTQPYSLQPRHSLPQPEGFGEPGMLALCGPMHEFPQRAAVSAS